MKVIKGRKAKQWKMRQTVDSRWEMISLLIPLGIEALNEILVREVQELVGARYSRKNHGRRPWGRNPGSVYLGDVKVPIEVPRVRDIKLNREVVLKAYDHFQDPKRIDDQIIRRVLKGVSTRDYEGAAMDVPEIFGIKESSISKTFVRASAERLKTFQEKRFDEEDFVVIFIDGKALRSYGMIVAVGIRPNGTKSILGFIEPDTENHPVMKDFLLDLKTRGLKVAQETLFVIDGAKGLRKGIQEVYGDKAFVQRCQFHKRENVAAYLPEKYKKQFRRKIDEAYACQQYVTAKRRLHSIIKELEWINKSAAASLEEGLEETLTLHRLGLHLQLGRSLRTTNIIENVNSMIEKYLHRICYWKNSLQRQRWLASALMDIEPRLKRIVGYSELGALRRKMRLVNQLKNEEIKVLRSVA
jgi:transposase-like protein